MRERASTWVYNLFSFKGRIRRSDYWVNMVIIFVAMVTLMCGLAAYWRIDLADQSDIRASAVQAGVIVLFMWPNLAVSAKRLHDRNQSAWWIVLSFVPIIGNAWTIINLGILRGTPGDNRYGSEPQREQMTLIQRNVAAA